MAGRRGTIEERFWPKVDRRGADDCWTWSACRNADGYGKFGLNAGRPCLAHRVSWTINRGPIPDGLFVLHRCDNPPCVNPNHLFLGTNRDNALDMVAKGRANGFRRLDAASVREIKRLLPTMTHAAIAEQFGIGTSTVQHIKRGRAWAHVQ